MKKFLLVLFAVIIISACVQQSGEGKLMIKMSADPNPVFANSQTTLYIDVENNSTREYKNVEIKLFDCAGFISQGKNTCECSKQIHNFNSGSLQTLQCLLTAPDIPETATKTLYGAFKFNNEFNLIKTFELISKNEYQRRINTHSLQILPRYYNFNDKNIAVEIEFSSDLPLIEDGDKYFYITISNIGGGFVNIKKDDISINLVQGSAVEKADCNIGTFDIIENTKYPRIACKIPNLKEDIVNYDININIKYQYEFRQRLDIIVKR